METKPVFEGLPKSKPELDGSNAMNKGDPPLILLNEK
jgi:hypothetical protein